MNSSKNNFKQTDIGLIPEDWEFIKLGDEDIKPILEIRNGLADKQTDNDGDFKVTRIETISNENIDLERTKFISSISDDKIQKYLIRKGDILFSHINSDPHIGKSALAKRNYDDLLHGLNLLLFKANEDVLSPEFLNYIFNYYRSIGLFIKICSRAVNQSSINQGKLKNLSIPLPSLPEQKKIAHILSKIQQAIETQEKIIKTSQELKKALMQKLFTEGLNPATAGQKETAIGLIPESWEVVKLGRYAKILNGFAFKSKDYVKKGIPLIRISNVSFGYLISKDDKYLPESYIERYSDYALNEGDLILSLTRPVTSGGMKYCFIEKKHLPALLNQRVGRFKIIDNCLSKEFLYHTVFSKYFIGELEKLFGSSSQQPNVSPSQLESFKIPLPPKPIQTEITNSLNSVNSKILNSEQLIISLKSLFISLLNNLMTGQIRVKDIEFEVVEIKKEAEIIPIHTKTATPEFKRTVLAAEIVSQSLDDPLFNKTKFQKILYLAEYAGELKLVSNYHRDAAGPYDNQMMRSIESQFKKLKWYGSKKVELEIKYFPLEKAGGHKKYFDRHWGEHSLTINNLIELLRPFDYDRCAIIATLFAAWNDLILRIVSINEDLIISEFYVWHPGKKKYKPERLKRALNWMKENGLVPKGFGKTTFKK